jgi:hypothetical protein
MEIWKIIVQSQSRQKVCETPSQPTAGMVIYSCHPSYAGSINRRIVVQACLDIKKSPITKNN